MVNKEVKHPRLIKYQHYSGSKGCRSLGINMSIASSEVYSETVLHLQGLNTKGTMANCGLVLDFDYIDEFIEALQDLKKEYNEDL